MIKMPASNSPTTLLSMFASVLLILIGGAWWVKQTAMTITPTTNQVETPESIPAETQYETVTQIGRAHV